MSESIKFRAQALDGITEIRMLVPHPMETGMRKDAETGKTIPADHIRVLAVHINERLVLEAHLNTAVAKNPVFAFKVRGGKPGDRVRASWIDTKGDQRSDEVLVQ